MVLVQLDLMDLVAILGQWANQGRQQLEQQVSKDLKERLVIEVIQEEKPNKVVHQRQLLVNEEESVNMVKREKKESEEIKESMVSSFQYKKEFKPITLVVA